MYGGVTFNVYMYDKNKQYIGWQPFALDIKINIKDVCKEGTVYIRFGLVLSSSL